MSEPFRLRRVLRQTLSLWARNLPLLLALVFVVLLPWFVFQVIERVFLQDVVWASEEAGRMLVGTLLSVAYGALEYLSQAVVVFAVYRRLQGGRASFPESFRGGLRRALPVLGVVLCLVGLQIGLVLALWAAAWSFAGEDLYAHWKEIVAVYLVLVMLVLTPLWVAVPAAVVERGGGYLRRSLVLTRGARGRIYLLLLLLYAANGALYFVVEPRLWDAPWARLAFWLTNELLFTSFLAVLAAVGYHALRLAKEGVDVATLDEIFG